jgi:hypothetical protein
MSTPFTVSSACSNYRVDIQHGFEFKVENEWFKQYLPLNTKYKLIQLSKHIGVYTQALNAKTIAELSTFLKRHIYLDVPEIYKQLLRGPDMIYDRFRDIPQIYIPLSKQDENGFYYPIKLYGEEEQQVHFIYPFNRDSPKHALQNLCKAAGIMLLKESKKFTTEELAELLNEKFILQERGS